MKVKKEEKKIKFTSKLGSTKQDLKKSIVYHIEHSLGKDEYSVTELDWYKSFAMTVRDRLMNLWNKTQKTYYAKDAKRVYYLSLEFLPGRSLSNSIINLGIQSESANALKELGHKLEEIEELEHDAGLGNGGLGRLAACFLDSMACLQIPGYGYGLRYEYGIFSQVIKNGKQVEEPDPWLQFGNVWEIERPESMYVIKFGGSIKEKVDKKGNIQKIWKSEQKVMALAYDTPVPGYNNNTVNTMRLWSAKSTQEFDLNYFNHGDYIKAVEDKNITENITRVLYPNDNVSAGKELRLKQEYFFVSASLQDIIRRYKKERKNFNDFSEKVAIQLNDTHPVLAIPELMRIFVDEENLSWEASWQLCVKTFAYTNHTILPEALEKWSVSLIEKLLPRHLEIIYEINQKFLDEIKQKFPNNIDMLRNMSIIEEGNEKFVRMANLAIIGSHSINGVAKLHSELIKQKVFPEFALVYPKRFNNKTNGITPRRWLKIANPLLAELITEKIGDKWITNFNELKKIVKFIDDKKFVKRWQEIKQQNKQVLSKIILETTGVIVNPCSLFDVQVKRIHEYKRQLLNILHVIYMYNQLKKNGISGFVPRTVVFAGKAAPSYEMAKLIINLITAVGSVVNCDKDIKNALKVVFIPNYGVSLAEKIFPSADLSEQISTAGMEASGTGNMKFALNGALTIGTLDGANIEIKQEVGDENCFIFGLTADEVAELKNKGYNSRDYYENNLEIKEVLDMIHNDYFSFSEKGLFKPIFDTLVNQGDYFMHLADFESYIECQKRVSEEYKDQKQWVKKSIINCANMGYFSGDRAIKEYAEEIWNVKSIKPCIKKQ
jgi:glycogen phosphorylase